MDQEKLGGAVTGSGVKTEQVEVASVPNGLSNQIVFVTCAEFNLTVLQAVLRKTKGYESIY